jgi:hypothetical protein
MKLFLYFIICFGSILFFWSWGLLSLHCRLKWTGPHDSELNCIITVLCIRSACLPDEMQENQEVQDLTFQQDSECLLSLWTVELWHSVISQSLWWSDHLRRFKAFLLWSCYPNCLLTPKFRPQRSLFELVWTMGTWKAAAFTIILTQQTRSNKKQRDIEIAMFKWRKNYKQQHYKQAGLSRGLVMPEHLDSTNLCSKSQKRREATNK